ncbi:hypothetical protein [Myxococcus xanthus]|uniref:hypothetical protein n=1 Tax=Myxococcus xanthus TaxID=34 RepID=UPI00112745ED|nr:hypothetical protein [Myxococcus xanthus]
MKTWVKWLWGISLDVVVLGVGAVASFVAFAAWSEGTLTQYWTFRVGFMAAPAMVIALISAGALRDAAWHCWLRFGLFETVSVLLVWAVPGSPYVAGTRVSETNVLFSLAVLLDVAVYGRGLFLMNRFMRRRSRGPSVERRVQTKRLPSTGRWPTPGGAGH